MYTPKNRATKYYEAKTDITKSTTVVWDFGNSLSVTNTTDRQKICKNIKYSNNIINQ